jgi:conjugative transfer signal peptidase TraF
MGGSCRHRRQGFAVSPERSKFIKQTTTIALSVWAGLFLFQTFSPYGIRANVTPSIPMGLYLTHKEVPAQLVRGTLVCFKYEAPVWARSRDYAPEGYLHCKPVWAVPGDYLEVTGNQISLLGAEGYRAKAVALPTDIQGRSIPLALKTERVPDGQYALLSTYHPRSFDSRYLGLVPLNKVVSVITPLVTF